MYWLTSTITENITWEREHCLFIVRSLVRRFLSTSKNKLSASSSSSASLTVNPLIVEPLSFYCYIIDYILYVLQELTSLSDRLVFELVADDTSKSVKFSLYISRQDILKN